MEQNLFLDREALRETRELTESLGASIDIEGLRRENAALDEKAMAPGFWDDTEAARKVIKQQNLLRGKIEAYDAIIEGLEEQELMLELMEEEGDFSFYEGFKTQVGALVKKAEEFKLETLLNGEYDDNDAIVSIHAGAGGTEAQDWADMLYRMYRRYGDQKGFSVETVDLLTEDEAGIKSVTMKFSGPHAYGYLRGEKGVHRLVRISPFDAAKKRHTSFASLDVYPDLDEEVEVEIRDDDLKVDTYRSSGAGGQHVNTTDSAVRITHIPTGIVVQCQNERSQIQNRAKAMQMLKAKLAALALEEQKEKIEDLQGNYSQIAWGSQIRSYVFQPYTLVKDHRTGVEIGDVNRVMDGDLDPFVYGYLQMKAGE